MGEGRPTNAQRLAKQKMPTCWFCEKPRSGVALHTGRNICAKCIGFMQHGVICIGVVVPLDTDTMIDKIYRDGNWCVLAAPEYAKRFRAVPTERFAFITPDAWLKAGLPRFGKHGASHNEQVEDAPPSVSEEIAEVITEETGI